MCIIVLTLLLTSFVVQGDLCANVICPDLGQCQTSTCNPNTGSCEIAIDTSYSVCDDGRVDTINDRCVEGKCSGVFYQTPLSMNEAEVANICGDHWCIVNECRIITTTVDTNVKTQVNMELNTPCKPIDQCHVGFCDGTDAGNCVQEAKPNGTLCDDTDFRTENDQCWGGKCRGVGDFNDPNCTEMVDSCCIEQTFDEIKFFNSDLDKFHLSLHNITNACPSGYILQNVEDYSSDNGCDEEHCSLKITPNHYGTQMHHCDCRAIDLCANVVCEPNECELTSTCDAGQCVSVPKQNGTPCIGDVHTGDGFCRNGVCEASPVPTVLDSHATVESSSNRLSTFFLFVLLLL